MDSLALQLIIIVALVLLNGVFAMAEIALVSARRTRLRQLADTGSGRARLALDLAESPNRFLATVQIGITLVGITAGAFGEATLANNLTALFGDWGVSRSVARWLGLALVVTLLTYLSLVVGELVPKRLGLHRAESIAMLVAPVMQGLSRLAAPAVWLLGASTDLLLRLLGIRASADSKVSEDEVKSLLREGMRAGVFLPVESVMVEGALELDHIPVRQLMTPRAKIIWINQNDPHDAIWHKIVVSGHSTFPVYEGNRDNVVGVVSVKAIYAHLAAGLPVSIKDLMTPHLVVPASQTAVALLETFRKSRRHVAVVTDEFGGVAGLITLHDIMEAVLGDFPSQDERLKPVARQREDGSWLVDALMDVADFEKQLPAFKLDPPDVRDYRTFAGYVVKRLGRVPTEGEFFDAHGFRVEVLDMDKHRVDKVLLMPLPLGNKAAATASADRPEPLPPQ